MGSLASQVIATSAFDRMCSDHNNEIFTGEQRLAYYAYMDARSRGFEHSQIERAVGPDFGATLDLFRERYESWYVSANDMFPPQLSFARQLWISK